jgi:hypothetical protein
MSQTLTKPVRLPTPAARVSFDRTVDPKTMVSNIGAIDLDSNDSRKLGVESGTSPERGNLRR